MKINVGLVANFFCLVAVLVPGSASIAAGGSPSDWVKVADGIRNPSESFEMKIRVESDENTSLLQVYLKGQDKTLVVTREPARDRGRNMLMLDREFHAYVPNLKRSMKLSLAQKLQGQVANGDISRTRWHGDYEVKLEKSSDKEDQVLLKGVKDNLTYAWIRLWLQKKTHRPIRAEYMGLNGKTVIKRAYFEDYKQISGAVRPTTMRIEDTAGKKSFVRILSMQSKSNPDSFFTVRNMETMK
jgi:outer membrane lipoprotein-sorting protein